MDLLQKLEEVVGNENYLQKLQELFDVCNDHIVETGNQDNAEFILEVRNIISSFITDKALSGMYGK